MDFRGGKPNVTVGPKAAESDTLLAYMVQEYVNRRLVGISLDDDVLELIFQGGKRLRVACEGGFKVSGVEDAQRFNGGADQSKAGVS